MFQGKQSLLSEEIRTESQICLKSGDAIIGTKTSQGKNKKGALSGSTSALRPLHGCEATVNTESRRCDTQNELKIS